MGYAATDVGLVLLVGEGRGDLAHGMEAIEGHIGTGQTEFQLVQCGTFSLGYEFMEVEDIVEMVELQDIAEEDVEHVGGIVEGLGLVLDINLLEIADGIERGEAPQGTAVQLAGIALEGELLHELTDEGIAAVLGRNVTGGGTAVGIGTAALAMPYTHLCQGSDADEGMGILARMIVAGLHEDALLGGVAEPQIGTHGSE